MLQAISDNIIVELMFKQKEGLIQIPESAFKYKKYDCETYGKIISIGKNFRYKDELKERDLVSFQKHEGIEIKYNGKIFLKLKSKWILGKVEL